MSGVNSSAAVGQEDKQAERMKKLRELHMRRVSNTSCADELSKVDPHYLNSDTPFFVSVTRLDLACD